MNRRGKCEGWPKANMKPTAYYVSADGMKSQPEAYANAILNPATAHADGKPLKTGMGSIYSVGNSKDA